MSGQAETNEVRAARLHAVTEALAEVRDKEKPSPREVSDAPLFLGALAVRGWKIVRE